MKDILDRVIKSDQPESKDIIVMLKACGEDQKALLSSARLIKNKSLGNKVYFRGLIEFSNICSKDCLYCGIRKGNFFIDRYNISDQDIINAAGFARANNYASIVLQSGEIFSPVFTRRIENLLKKIHKATDGSLRITLSLGEQDKETYIRWFNSGAHRYLLRIETSNPDLYVRIHPQDDLHNFDKRLQSLYHLKSIGYQTGTGVMIGLPGQTYEDLANDILFMKTFEIDMVGMGPYIEHSDTPLFNSNNSLNLQQRFSLTLNMIAVLRIVMPKINIAAATALQAIDKMGREKAILAGANVIMPNITPGIYRDSYSLYNNKPCTDENADDCINCLDARIKMTGSEIGYGEWGDSIFFIDKSSSC
ncbi:MAG: [FeFe] hydrogenase H-cluster radical SAM maturase HydE [Bacteroidales bacterium]|nr:[FeFe] hydrogenase H-cluster radical SAM maturase HydE [Bacteroidales bacterium]